MFKNLNAEMARENISKMDIANVLGVNTKTVSNKINGKTEFTLSEVKKIANMFPNVSISYLFDIQDKSA